MDNFRNAIKAFIVHDGKMLLIKRRSTDAHEPGTWDQPGGRLELGESPFTGLQREVAEETGLTIEILTPIDIHFFVRDDGQKIQLTVFLCNSPKGEIKLSEEHTEYQWKDLNDPVEEFPKNFQCCIKKFKQFEFAKNM